MAPQIRALPESGAGQDLDLLFTATPSGAAGKIFLESGNPELRGIDLSADYRLPEDLYSQAYGENLSDPGGQAKAVYGLTEWVRKDLPGARMVANPGCYPEASLLALAPAVREGLVADDIIIDAKSGISGAGRGGQSTNSEVGAAERDEDVVGGDDAGSGGKLVQRRANRRAVDQQRGS